MIIPTSTYLVATFPAVLQDPQMQKKLLLNPI